MQAPPEGVAAPASRLPAASPPSVLSAPHVIATGLEGVMDPEAEEHEQLAGLEHRHCQPRCLDSPNYRMDHALAEAAHAASHAEHAAMGEHEPLAAQVLGCLPRYLLAAMSRGCGQWLQIVCAKGKASCLTGCRAACCHVVALQEIVYAMDTVACTVPHGMGHTLAEVMQAALHMCCRCGWSPV